MQQVNCYLCGANDYSVIFQGTGSELELTPSHIAARKGSINKDYSYRWVRCNKCGLVYANPVPSEELLSSLYASSDQSAYVEEEENISFTYARYLNKIRRHIGHFGKALDIGAGNGLFLRTLMKNGFEQVTGIEPSARACHAAHDDVSPFLKNAVFDENDFDPGTLDFISCFQTLEHIHNPDKLIESFSRLLSKDGIVFCIAHNFGSIGVKILGSRHPIVNAGHLTLFDISTLPKLFSKHFEIVDVFNIRNRYSCRYWISLLPFKQSAKSSMVKIGSFFGVDTMPVTLSMGNIGLIARKR
jgi:SAM-dependent methyltransferase